jgi:hypothetical protein
VALFNFNLEIIRLIAEIGIEGEDGGDTSCGDHVTLLVTERLIWDLVFNLVTGVGNEGGNEFARDDGTVDGERAEPAETEGIVIPVEGVRPSSTEKRFEVGIFPAWPTSLNVVG